jgi:hypothetical protein
MQTRIAGIPCTVDYTIRGKYKPAKIDAPPEFCYEAEYPDVEFTVCDRNGRPAPWLERKMTDEDRQRIEVEILEDAQDD